MGLEGSNGSFDGCKPQKVGGGTLITPLGNLFLRCLHKDMARFSQGPAEGGGGGEDTSTREEHNMLALTLPLLLNPTLGLFGGLGYFMVTIGTLALLWKPQF